MDAEAQALAIAVTRISVGALTADLAAAGKAVTTRAAANAVLGPLSARFVISIDTGYVLQGNSSF